MNRLPPARPGVSSCSIRLRTRAARPALSLRTRIALLRGSGTSVTRCCGSACVPPPCPDGSASRRITSPATSMADACFTGTSSGSLRSGTSSDVMIRSIRLRLSA